MAGSASTACATDKGALDFMEPIARFLDTLPPIESSSAMRAPDPITAAIEQATMRLISFVDEIDAMLDDAQAHADAVVRAAYAEAARIVGEAQRTLNAHPTAPADSVLRAA